MKSDDTGRRGPLRRLAALLPGDYLDLGRVATGTLGRNILRGFLKLLTAGFLSPASLGILRSVFALFKIASSVADLGLQYALVTFVSAARRDDDEPTEQRTLFTVLALSFVAMGVTLFAGSLAAPAVATRFLGDAGLTVYVRLAMLAVGGQVLWRFLSGYLSARQQFTRLAGFLITMPTLMLAAALVLVVLGRFTLESALLVYLLGPAAAVLLWWPTLDSRFLRFRMWDGALAARLLRFSRWIYLTGFASANRSHLNPLLLKNPALSGSVAAGETNAGLYSFGNDLANEVTVLSKSLLIVMLPKASSKSTRPKLRRFVLRSYRHLALLALPMLSLMLLAKPLIHALAWIRPTYLEYLPSLPVFAVLYIGTLFSIAAIPIQSALYAMGLPQIESYLELATIPVMVVGGILLIPRYGAQGAAMVVLFQRIVSFAALLTVGLKKLREPEEGTA